MTIAKPEKPTAGGLVKQYGTDFATVLPTHVKPEQWVRLAQGALKKGKRNASGQFELEEAALNNPGVFLAALLDAARLGLEPGTEQYYLTPRKVKGRLEILGIVGYQGLVELMYRAGAVSSVVAEVVRVGDVFQYQPGRDERPVHVIDWDAEDRGQLRLVYAYAVMRDGATSKVVVLNKADIARIKLSSQGANSEYSPWTTNPAAMWLKSAVRQLAKWVPTSAEYRREQLRAVAAVQAEGTLAAQVQDVRRTQLEAIAEERDVEPGEYVDAITGEVSYADPDQIEGEPQDEPEPPDVEQQQATVRDLKAELRLLSEDAAPAPRVVAPKPRTPKASREDRARIMALFTRLKVSERDKQHTYMAGLVGHPVTATDDLTPDEAALVIANLEGMTDPIDAAGAMDGDSIDVSSEPDED
ncbi:MAG: recombinase RecT [Actinobacteria bacterium]|nr:recombinase RecT [Actinomycetota bacterium]